MNLNMTHSPSREAAEKTAQRRWRLSLARSARGRVLLHVLALCEDGHVRWHLAGIAREMVG